MHKYFLELSYNGAAYHGWQRQKTAVSVQSTIEDSLSKLLKKKITIHGCGRTDAGVHASKYFAHFYAIETLSPEFLYKINRILPEDITISKVIEVPVEANAQKSAISRTYHYHFNSKVDVFIADTSWKIFDCKIDLSKVAEITGLIVKQKDFKIFCKQVEKHKSTLCRIDHFDVIEKEAGKYVLKITANRFLRSMIRLLTPVIIDVLSDKLSIRDFRSHLIENKPFENMSIAPPQGLFLVEVEYNSGLL